MRWWNDEISEPCKWWNDEMMKEDDEMMKFRNLVNDEMMKWWKNMKWWNLVRWWNDEMMKFAQKRWCCNVSSNPGWSIIYENIYEPVDNNLRSLVDNW